MKDLQLYVIPSCPFCKRVTQYLDKNQLSVPIKDITTDDEAMEYLKRVGGKIQAPCLFIDGEPMYESSDIIDYFKQNA